MTYFGHSANSEGIWQTLLEHSQGVARRAKSHAGEWHGREEAEFAGTVHDVGKYPDSFQNRLRGIGSGLDHWSAGCHLSLRSGLMAAAFATYGHHVGLPPGSLLKNKKTLAQFGENHPQGLKLTTDDVEQLHQRMKADGLCLPAVSNPVLNDRRQGQIGKMLAIRRLFSTLTDADFLDTEEHMQATARKAGRSLDPESLLAKLEKYLGVIRASNSGVAEVQKVRDQVLSDCRTTALGPQGVYTLTAPTGAGKTLAMMAFALEHARIHGLRRIITVLPFLTIIEQTARVYREALDLQAEDLIEHHSLASGMYDAMGEEVSRRLRSLTENWDAPLVVTTSVQFLESLFADKPSRCRKLHRIANSVVLMDEVQTIPTDLAKYTLTALNSLVNDWGCTVVMATATQPAFEHLSPQVQSLGSGPWSPSPIVKDTTGIFSALRRNSYQFLKKSEPLSDSELADRLEGETQALVVVNLKRQAQSLFETLAERGRCVYHLSTRNCPAHRTQILSEVKDRLVRGQEVMLVSTQCIEAGVDVDFPRLFRAYAPLDSIIQAAGRCNREGRLANGPVTVYQPEDQGLPPGAYTQATLKTYSKLQSWFHKDPFFDDPSSPERIRDYFQSLYEIGKLKKPDLDLALKDFHFPQVSEEYRLINQDTVNILVPYKKCLTLYRHLLEEAEAHGICRGWMARAQPITVSEFRPRQEHALWGYLVPLRYRPSRRGPGLEVPDWFIYNEQFYQHYHEALGLVPPEEMPEFII